MMTQEQTLNSLPAMPQNQDAERAILGSILCTNDVIYGAASRLEPSDFTLDSHKRIFAELLEMSNSGTGIDSATLCNHLGNKKLIESCGGVHYISSLTEGLPRRDNINPFIEQVKKISGLRKIIHACTSGIAAASERSADPEECYGAVNEALLRVVADSRPEEVTKLSDLLGPTLVELEHLAKYTGAIVGLSTGVPELDRATTGVRAGELWIVGGRPGDGKSSLGKQAAVANVRQGIPTLMFSKEMTGTEVTKGLIASESKVGSLRIRDPRRLQKEHWSSVIDSLSTMADWPLYIDESSGLDIRQLTARAKLYIKRKGVRLIVVDYLQLISGPGKDNMARVGNVANQLRQLAKDTQVPILCLSQLSRPRDKNLNERPNMLHLKESGDIEAHAHVVLLLYRPRNEGDNSFTGQDEIILGKQRNGPIGTSCVQFNGHNLSFDVRA